MRAMTMTPVLAMLAACASSGPESQPGMEEPVQVESGGTSTCVFHSVIDSFEPLDDRRIVLFDKGKRKAYLAEMATGCFNIEMQTMFAAVDGDGNGQICGQSGDSLAYRRLNSVENCRILGLHELSDERRLELGVGAPPSKSK